METIVFDLNEQKSPDEAIRTCANLIRQGEIVVFPTETVYGLGANAYAPGAVQKIFEAKGRPGDNPLIVHVAERAQVDDLVQMIPPKARQLMDAFWPGPLTLIMPVSEKVPKVVTAGLETVAVRMPSAPTAGALILAAGVPIAAPSANVSGRPSPTEGQHVLEDMAGRVPAILIKDEVEVGLESTVVDMTSEPPTLLRPGGITPKAMERVIGPIALSPNIRENIIPDKVMSPGMKYRHYAPKGQVFIVRGSMEDRLAQITQAIQLLPFDSEIGILTTEEGAGRFTDSVFDPVRHIETLGSAADPEAMSRHLFDALRGFDASGVQFIFAEDVPVEDETLALINRLYKAAGYTFLDEALGHWFPKERK